MPKTIQELFEHELRDIYDAENKLVRALEQMSKKVTNQELSRSFTEHQKMTEGQIQRLEKVFEAIDRKPRREPCAGINGLIEEFSKMVEEDPSPEVLDVFACGAGTKVEHYEIGAYTALCELAQALGKTEVFELLNQTLTEEQETLGLLESMQRKLGKQTIVLPETEGAAR